MTPADDLTRVCYVFHKNGVRFLVIGARACALHGHIRATQDVDLLIEDTDRNIERAIAAIRELYPQLTEGLSVADVRESVVVKILDEPELDVSLSAWSVSYDRAARNQQSVILDDVEIPFIGLDELIESKSTARDQDRWDISVLREIQKKKARKRD